MNIIKYPTQADYETICKRPQMDVSQLNAIVSEVLQDIKANGDKAVIVYEEKFDKAQLQQLAVTEAEIQEAENLVDRISMTPLCWLTRTLPRSMRLSALRARRLRLLPALRAGRRAWR